MYIWLAIDVDDQLKNLKGKVKEVERQVNFVESGISLPMHISLRITSLIEDDMYDNIVNDIKEYSKSLKPFEINTEKIELHETISWLKMEENENLTKIHNHLTSQMLEKYNIPLHDYDKNFTYHSTLFMDSDVCKVKEAFLKIMDAEYPKVLKANKLIIGSSETGSIGTYHVDKIIEF